MKQHILVLVHVVGGLIFFCCFFLPNCTFAWMPVGELLPGHLSQPCVNSIWATTWPPFCFTFLFRALGCLGGCQLKALSVDFVSLELDKNIFFTSKLKQSLAPHHIKSQEGYLRSKQRCNVNSNQHLPCFGHWYVGSASSPRGSWKAHL